MVDTETTGTDPAHAAVIQISAVRFDLIGRSVDSDQFFDRCLHPLPNRYWEESTRDWWLSKNKSILQDLLARREDPTVVLNDFWDWCLDGCDKQKPLRVWARPATFDVPILASHFHQIGRKTPWHYRYAMDMNSFIRGMAKDPDGPLYFADAVGPAHNALVDVLNQIGNLFSAVDHYEG